MLAEEKREQINIPPPDHIREKLSEDKRPRLARFKNPANRHEVPDFIGRVALDIIEFRPRDAGMYRRQTIKPEPEEYPNEANATRGNESPLPTVVYQQPWD